MRDDIISAPLLTGEFVIRPSVVEALGMPVGNEAPPAEVELRCPTGPRKLFAKLRLAHQSVPITSDNLIEMACQDCRRRLRGEGRDVAHVLHRFDISGALVETVFVNREG